MFVSFFIYVNFVIGENFRSANLREGMERFFLKLNNLLSVLIILSCKFIVNMKN
jgi:hypothetical protein